MKPVKIFTTSTLILFLILYIFFLTATFSQLLFLRYIQDPEIENSIKLHVANGIQRIQLSDDFCPHSHFHSLCSVEFEDFMAIGIPLNFHLLDGGYCCEH